MIVRQYAPCSLGRSIICLGKQGEINALRVEFDVSAWMAMYPDATVKLMHFAPDRPQDNPVIPTLGVEGTLRVWIVGEEDTAGAGNGVIELLLIDERTGSTIKSATGYTTVLRSPSAGIEAQEPEPGYVRYDVDQSALLTDTQKAFARTNIDAIKDEKDPTVPDWAKQPSKPTYTASEVGALPSSYTPPVTSVNGMTGAVALSAQDVGARPDTWTPSASEVGADAAGTASGAVAAHNVSGAAHADLRALIDGLTSRLNALADSDDTTLDQLSEIVAYIKSNKALIDAVTTGKVSTSDIVDNLTTNSAGKVLSAAQGVRLKALIDAIVIPDKLPNPQPLTINGQRYDGSEAVTMTTVEIDDTLTQSGKAADAKAVGDQLSALKDDIADIEQVVMAGYSFNLITDTFLLKDINTWSDVSSLNLSNYTYDSANFNVYQIHVVGGKSYYFFNANSTTNKLEYLQVPNLIVFDASGNASERKSGQYSFGAIEDGYIAISTNKALKVVIADHDVHGEDYIEHKKLPKEFAEKKDINNIEEKLTGIDRRVSLLESNEAETVIPNVVKSKLLAKSINTWSDISSLKTDNYTYDNEDFNNYFAEVTETGRYWFYRNNNGEASDVTFPNIITFDADGNALERFSSKAYVDVTKNVAFVSFDYNKNYDCMLVKGGYTGNFYGIGEPLRENTRHYDTFSILGDSYSTFDGYLKDERAGAWYPADSTKPNNDVTKVDETWWYQFANNYGCTLIANNSWAGTTIGYDSYSEGLDDGKESSFLKRYNNLDRPELIFIFGGTNDEWASNDTGRSDFLGDYKYSDFSESDFVYFRPSLAKLIDSVQHNNIGAKIVFVLNSGLVKINDSVETICNHYGIDLIKLNNIAKGNSHPTIEGMKTIAYEIEWFLRQRK